MKYNQQQIEEKIQMVFKDIRENGMSLRDAVKGYDMPCINTVMKWISDNPEYMRQYTYAREARADLIFEEILDIADKQGKDVIGTDEHGNDIIDHNVINRNRLQIDARKWMLGKMSPNRFGDKLDVNLGGQENNPIVIKLGNGMQPKEDLE